MDSPKEQMEKLRNCNLNERAEKLRILSQDVKEAFALIGARSQWGLLLHGVRVAAMDVRQMALHALFTGLVAALARDDQLQQQVNTLSVTVQATRRDQSACPARTRRIIADKNREIALLRAQLANCRGQQRGHPHPHRTVGSALFAICWTPPALENKWLMLYTSVKPYGNP